MFTILWALQKQEGSVTLKSGFLEFKFPFWWQYLNMVFYLQWKDTFQRKTSIQIWLVLILIKCLDLCPRKQIIISDREIICPCKMFFVQGRKIFLTTRWFYSLLQFKMVLDIKFCPSHKKEFLILIKRKFKLFNYR